MGAGPDRLDGVALHSGKDRVIAGSRDVVVYIGRNAVVCVRAIGPRRVLVFKQTRGNRVGFIHVAGPFVLDVWHTVQEEGRLDEL